MYTNHPDPLSAITVFQYRPTEKRDIYKPTTLLFSPRQLRPLSTALFNSTWRTERCKLSQNDEAKGEEGAVYMPLLFRGKRLMRFGYCGILINIRRQLFQIFHIICGRECRLPFTTTTTIIVSVYILFSSFKFIYRIPSSPSFFDETG